MSRSDAVRTEEGHADVEMAGVANGCFRVPRRDGERSGPSRSRSRSTARSLGTEPPHLDDSALAKRDPDGDRLNNPGRELGCARTHGGPTPIATACAMGPRCAASTRTRASGTPTETGSATAASCARERTRASARAAQASMLEVAAEVRGSARQLPGCVQYSAAGKTLRPSSGAAVADDIVIDSARAAVDRSAGGDVTDPQLATSGLRHLHS